jgi:MerR family transcriptional regulator, light-induced transcriptional regulator
MRTVVKLTGVGPHKLRFWEGRYGLISPSRTRSGHRLYSKKDLEQIKAIADLVENQGFSLVAVKEMMEGAVTQRTARTAIRSGESTVSM